MNLKSISHRATEAVLTRVPMNIIRVVASMAPDLLEVMDDQAPPLSRFLAALSVTHAVAEELFGVESVRRNNIEK